MTNGPKAMPREGGRIQTGNYAVTFGIWKQKAFVSWG